MSEFLNAVTEWSVALAGTPWVFIVLLALATIDGFFPPVPSESVIIALAAVFVATDSPDFWILGAVAAAGAFCGDQIAYSIGKRIPIRRLRFMQGPRAQASLAWAERALAQRGAAFIIGARYIPVGRVAVNMTAGAVGYPRRRFSGLAAIAAISWSIYSVLLGVGAGHLFGEHHPLLAAAVGVAGGLALGVIIDQILSWWMRRKLARTPEGEAPGAVQPDDQRESPSDAVPPDDAVLRCGGSSG